MSQVQEQPPGTRHLTAESARGVATRVRERSSLCPGVCAPLWTNIELVDPPNSTVMYILCFVYSVSVTEMEMKRKLICNQLLSSVSSLI